MRAKMTIGLLHPGEMGSAVGACARAAGARVLWASEGRSAETRQRGAEAGLEDVRTLTALLAQSDVILSVCPPHAAADLARTVAAHRLSGVYVDANAIAPATAREIGAIVERAGAAFVDGGIVGPPPRTRSTTRLYLSGGEAKRVGAIFADSVLEAITVEGAPGAASALKMGYAAWTKVSAALLMAIHGMATAEGVEEALLREWERSQPELAPRSAAVVKANARKAWRFVGEMEEMAATFADAGLPDGFQQAAAEVYRRLARYKDVAAPPSIDEVARTLKARS